MKARAHVFVSGRVQGVFFRVETRYEANRRGIKGWVLNRSDGKVEAIFEGEKNDVDELVDFCRKGPKGAIVKKVEVLWEGFKEEFKDFEIRY